MSSVVMHTFKASSHLEGRLALVHINHLSIYKVALNLHASEGIIGAPVAPALGVDTEVQVLDIAYDVIEHGTGLECSPYLGLPDNLVGLIEVASKSYH